MAELWAKKIIKGERTFTDVPRLLKAKVKKILVKQGYDYLAK